MFKKINGVKYLGMEGVFGTDLHALLSNEIPSMCCVRLLCAVCAPSGMFAKMHYACSTTYTCVFLVLLLIIEILQCRVMLFVTTVKTLCLVSDLG